MGNPGPRYALTRHNVGFMVLDEMLHKYPFNYTKKGDRYELGEIRLEGVSLYFLKPLTFMNLSGTVLPEVLNTLKINDTEKLLIIYDDVALPLGKIRIRINGSSGGHNGIKSIIDNLRTQSFGRLRIGIGPKPPQISLTDYVLGEFSMKEYEVLRKIIKVSIDAVNCIIKEGFEEAMRIYNSLELSQGERDTIGN